MRYHPSLSPSSFDIRPTVWGCGLALAGWAVLVAWVYTLVTR